MTLLIICIVAICMIIFAGLLLALSPGKPYPVVDEKGRPLMGGMAEKIKVNLNGVDMGMFITTTDWNNPVLLFLHGGPGMPEYFLTQRYPTGLEKYFTVCWWDQRGAGLSYHADLPPESLTVEQMISDTLAVTNYLRSRFGKEKIFLMAHSGGSFTGIQAAARAPELYHAYIGMGQMTYQLQSEALAYEYMLEHYKAQGNGEMLRKLEAAPPTMTVPLPAAYDQLRDDAMHGIGIGTTRTMDSVIAGVFLPSWLSPVFTLAEKVNLWRGKIFSMRALRNEMFATDLTRQVAELNLPVYFFHGRYDYTCAYPLAKEYLLKLKAPVKGFYTFEQSAHSPFFEEPEKLLKIMKENVLLGSVSLADAP